MNAISFELLWYKVFVHRKLKLLKFLMDSVLLSCGAYCIYAPTVYKLRKACGIICM